MQVRSLAWEILYAMGMAKNNKEQKIEISATDGKVISFEEEVND